MSLVDWRPPSLAVRGGGSIAARHAWCVGRNYAEHAREMGAEPGDPLFFSKPAAAIVQADLVPYPPRTRELHHEVELVAVLGQGGSRLSADRAATCIVAWGVGCDLTRRDVQAKAKQAGGPWALAKGFDASGPVGELVPATDWYPEPGHRIQLAVDEKPRQHATLGEMLRTVPELLAALSAEVTLHAGDLLFTGTPAGVGPLQPGQYVRAGIDGLPELAFRIGEPDG